MKTKRIRVEYEASGGFLHRWISGTGRFTMTVPIDASEERISNEALQEATIRAQKRIEHWNATVSDVSWEEILEFP